MDDFTVNMSLTSPEINQSTVGVLTGGKKMTGQWLNLDPDHKYNLYVILLEFLDY